MGNRVEDLERQVAELQAAVNGLTEELVEMKERVRQLEDAQQVAVDTEAEAVAAAEGPSSDASDTTVGERRTHSDDHVEVVERTGEPSSTDGPGADGTGAETTDSPADADGSDTETPPSDAETAAADADGSEAEDGESDDSDIIVA